MKWTLFQMELGIFGTEYELAQLQILGETVWVWGTERHIWLRNDDGGDIRNVHKCIQFNYVSHKDV